MRSQSDSQSANLSRRAFLGASAFSAVGATSLFSLPTTAFAAFESDADSAANDVVFRFAVMSDVHFNGDPNAPEVGRLRRALAFMYEYSAARPYKRFDALVVAGDVSNHGVEKEISLFKKTMDAGIKDGTKTIVCMGNHEFYGGNKELWKSVFNVEPNASYEVGGYRFVALSPERGSMADGDYLYALDWFDKELTAACDADPTGKKPVFVLQHYHVTPTVYGSRGDDNWGLRDLFDTLQKYPRVVDFSGHSHYPINDPRSAWQGRFSAFGTGTLSYFEMGAEGGKYDKFPRGYRDAAQFYVVEVRRDNSVALKPYDLISDSFFDVVYLIAEPGAIDRYVLTDERYKTSAKPVWADGAAVEVGAANPNGVELSFPQATCPDVVHSYRVDVERKGANGAWEPFGTEYFWSEYYFKNAPSTMKIELGELEDAADYRAFVTALNPFFKESETRLEAAFSTPKDETETVDKNAPAPDANELDLTFEDGAPFNAAKNARPAQKPIETFGAPKIVKDATLGGAFVAAFDGVSDFFKVPFEKADYAKMRRATIACKFKFDEFPSGAADVFANTEFAGVAFEINGKERKLELWASVSGRYEIVSAPIEAGRYVDAFGTFDGESVVLYLDGKEVARKSAKGALNHPQGDKTKAFCVGADVGPNGEGTSLFKGRVARARVFNWALTAEQVANLSK